MARFDMRMTDEMESALTEESQKTDMPLSKLVRMAIEQFLQGRGYAIKDTVMWGGKRERPGKKAAGAESEE